MGNFIKTRGTDLAILIVVLTALTATPAWAFAQLPGPEAGGIAGAAIIGVIIVAKWWRRG